MVTKFVVMLGLIGVTMAEHCETAWARLPDALSTNGERECFLDNADLNPNRWGWTNEIDGSAGWPLEIPIYAAAGRCDISKGWGIVGTLVVTYSEGVVNVKYESDSGFHYNDYHLFVSKSQYNTKKDGTTYTVAPGQFPFNHQSEVEVQGMTTPFFIQAHAVACSGDPPVTYHPTSPVTAPPSVAATAPPSVATAPPSVATAPPSVAATAPPTSPPILVTAPPTPPTGFPVAGNNDPTAPPGNLQSTFPPPPGGECPIEMTGANCTFSKFSCEDAPAPWSNLDDRFCGQCPPALEGACHLQCPHCASAGTEISMVCPGEWETCDVFVSVYSNCHTQGTDGGLAYNLEADGWQGGSCGPSFCLPFEATCQFGNRTRAVAQPDETNIRWHMKLFHKSFGGGESITLPQLATDPTMYFTSYVKEGRVCGNTYNNETSCTAAPGICQWRDGACDFELCPPRPTPPPPENKPCCDAAPGVATGNCEPDDPYLIDNACDFVLPVCTPQ